MCKIEMFVLFILLITSCNRDTELVQPDKKYEASDLLELQVEETPAGSKVLLKVITKQNVPDGALVTFVTDYGKIGNFPLTEDTANLTKSKEIKTAGGQAYATWIYQKSADSTLPVKISAVLIKDSMRFLVYKDFEIRNYSK